MHIFVFLNEYSCIWEKVEIISSRNSEFEVWGKIWGVLPIGLVQPFCQWATLVKFFIPWYFHIHLSIVQQLVGLKFRDVVKSWKLGSVTSVADLRGGLAPPPTGNPGSTPELCSTARLKKSVEFVNQKEEPTYIQWGIQDFQTRGANLWGEGKSLLFGKNFAENCMKMKEIAPGAFVPSAIRIRQ